MQKVSKQSLAMIALSILLAISIALTFTFAALTATKTASGSITFSATVGITISSASNVATVDDTGGTIKISRITDTTTLNNALKDVKIAVSAGSVACGLEIAISDITGGNAGVISGWVKGKVNVVSNGHALRESTETPGAVFTEKLTAGDYILLGDLVTATVDLSKIASDDESVGANFTVTINASAKGYLYA